MMISTKQQPGYIIAVTMVIIAIAVSLITYVYRRISISSPIAYSMVQKQKAAQLTLSGLGIARSFLSFNPEKKKEAGDEQKPNQKNEKIAQPLISAWHQKLLPVLNRPQLYKLTHEHDGVDATIGITISCEQGKINLNQIYDFGKKQFRSSKWESLMQEICSVLEKNVGVKELYSVLKKSLEQRDLPLNDITELLMLKEFHNFKHSIWYEPPSAKQSTSHPADEIRPLYLADIFTLYTSDNKIDPWVLSDSLCGLLGLRRVRADDIQDRVKILETVLKNFKTTYTWTTDWKQYMMPLYQKELQSLLKGIESVLQATTSPTIFSVYVVATCGRVSQRLCAIVERKKMGEGVKAYYTAEVRKVYRL